MAATTTTEAPESEGENSPGAFYRNIAWHKSAPDDVVEAGSWGEASAGWQAWSEHLARVKRPRRLGRRLRSASHPLLWSIAGTSGPDSPAVADVEKTVLRILRYGVRRRLAREQVPQELRRWLDDQAPLSANRALETLAWCYTLPGLAQSIAAPLWWELLGYLIDVSSNHEMASPEQDLLPWQILGGELPLTLAFLFPEIETCRRFRSSGAAAILAGAQQWLNSDATLHDRQREVLRPMLACWTRTVVVGEELKRSLWSAEFKTCYRGLVLQALRLTRRDGSQILSDEPARGEEFEMLTRAATIADDSAAMRLVEFLLPGKNQDVKLPRKPPSAAAHSERSQLGVLRTSWSPTCPKLTIGYSRRNLAVELDCGQELLASGDWRQEVHFNGERLLPSSDWEEVCWVSDEDVDYLELELNLGGRLVLQRQMMLARKDRFLLTADALLGSEVGQLDYRMELPVCPHVRFEGAAETREGRLLGRKQRALVLPLDLPEWRVDGRPGKLEASDYGLALSQSVSGRKNLFAPLFIDLDPKRFKRQLTWRPLTVAETRVAQPADVAVGYRVQIGKQQWLVYRSLAEAASRTVLGHHLLTQYLVGRFTRAGEVETLIEIE
jgi:hypothetical protein